VRGRELLLVSLLAIWPAAGALAEADAVGSAETLAARCRAGDKYPGLKQSPADDTNVGICFGYLSGFIEGRALGLAEAKAQSGAPACFPDDLTSGSLSKAFLEYADEYPEQLQGPAAVMLSDALRWAYPCTPAAESDQPSQ
jgi:hypothetical protein